MIVLVWILSVVILTIVFGEIYFRYLKCKKQINRLSVGNWHQSIDMDIDDLSIEHVSSDFVSNVKLSKRGSWRMAQDSVIDQSSLEELKSIEYSLKL